MNAVLAQLIADYLQRRAEREKIDAELGEIAEHILNRMAEGESVEIAPGQGVRVQRPSRRFDAEIAREILTPEQWQAIQVAAPSTERARALLTGALYEQCTRPAGGASLRVL